MAYNEYLNNIKINKNQVKVFLTNKTMLTGIIKDFDDDCVVVDKCMVFREHIISVSPE